MRHDGYCEYCGTKIRYENEIDILNQDLLEGRNIEILIKIRDEDNIKLIPLEGHISSVTQYFDNIAFYADSTKYLTLAESNFEIVFEGRLKKDRIKLEDQHD